MAIVFGSPEARAIRAQDAEQQRHDETYHRLADEEVVSEDYYATHPGAPHPGLADNGWVFEEDEEDEEYEEDEETAGGILDMEESFDERAAVAHAEAAARSRQVREELNLPPMSAGEHWLQIRRIRTDGGTQSRVRLDPIIVQDYSQQFTLNSNVPGGTAADNDKIWWGNFPALEVYLDGDYWLADGFHRLSGIEQALKRSGLPDFNIRNWRVLCRVHLGTKRDAILHAAGANANHGLRRTNADKRKSVETLLRDEEWQQWSDAEIARRCVVDPKTVANVRQQLVNTMEIHSDLARKTADGRLMNTANIGRRAEPVQFTSPQVLENMIWEWVQKYAKEVTRLPLDVLGFMDAAETDRAKEQRNRMAKWLREQGAEWRSESYLRQSISRVHSQQTIAQQQAQARKVYTEPAPKAEPKASSIDRINRDLDAYDAEARRVYAQPEPEPKSKLNLGYLPETERVEIDDAELRQAGFHLVRTKAPAQDMKHYWFYRFWWARFDGSVDSGPERDTAELAIEDARRRFAEFHAPDADEAEAIAIVEAETAQEDAERAVRDAQRPAFERVPEPEPVAEAVDNLDRLKRASLLRYMLVQARDAARRDYGDLTGRHTDMLEFERGVADMLPALDSLIAILGGPQANAILEGMK